MAALLCCVLVKKLDTRTPSFIIHLLNHLSPASSRLLASVPLAFSSVGSSVCLSVSLSVYLSVMMASSDVQHLPLATDEEDACDHVELGTLPASPTSYIGAEGGMDPADDNDEDAVADDDDEEVQLFIYLDILSSLSFTSPSSSFLRFHTIVHRLVCTVRLTRIHFLLRNKNWKKNAKNCIALVVCWTKRGMSKNLSNASLP